MAIPYVVRKKADLTSGERKELWYGVPSKIQDRGGVQNKELAQVVELRGGFHRGQVEGIYTGKLLAGTLKEHCLDIQEQAENMVEKLTKQIMAVEGISEDLKSHDQMEWVRRMNSIRNRVDEIVLTEIVYKI